MSASAGSITRSFAPTLRSMNCLAATFTRCERPNRVCRSSITMTGMLAASGDSIPQWMYIASAITESMDENPFSIPA